MTNVVVYRVETKDGEGPYRGGDAAYGIRDLMGDICQASEVHPSPWEDGIDPGPDAFFGFSTEDQMREWFSESIRTGISKKGFTCNAYSVPMEKVQFGKKQIAFDKNAASFVYEIPLGKVDQYALPL